MAPQVNIQLAGHKRQERLAKIRNSQQFPVVRVVPAGVEGRWKEEDMRRLMKHPISKMGFPSEGSAEWPLDQFTQRRLADGSVKLAEDNKAAQDRRQQQPQRAALRPPQSPQPAE